MSTVKQIQQMQYDNLRKCFNENLVYPILGKDYYNIAIDVYNSDKKTTEDLKTIFNNLNTSNTFYKIIFIISLIFNVLLLTFILS